MCWHCHVQHFTWILTLQETTVLKRNAWRIWLIAALLVINKKINKKKWSKNKRKKMIALELLHPGCRHPQWFSLHPIYSSHQELKCWRQVIIDNDLVKPVWVVKLDSCVCLQHVLELIFLKLAKISPLKYHCIFLTIYIYNQNYEFLSSCSTY